MKTGISTLFGWLLLGSAVSAQAQSLRCGNQLALTGDSKAAVLGKCGQPILQDSFCKPYEPSPNPSAAVIPCEQVDEWTYSPGSGKFQVRLRFEEGVLKSLTNGDRIP